MIDCNESPGEVSVNHYVKMPYRAAHTENAKKYDEECFAVFARHMLRRCQADSTTHANCRDFILADVDEEGTEGGALTITDPGDEDEDEDDEDQGNEIKKLIKDKGLDDDVESFLRTMWQDMLHKADEDKLGTLNFDDARMRYGQLPWVQVFWSVC